MRTAYPVLFECQECVVSAAPDLHGNPCAERPRVRFQLEPRRLFDFSHDGVAADPEQAELRLVAETASCSRPIGIRVENPPRTDHPLVVRVSIGKHIPYRLGTGADEDAVYGLPLVDTPANRRHTRCMWVSGRRGRTGTRATDF